MSSRDIANVNEYTEQILEDRLRAHLRKKKNAQFAEKNTCEEIINR